MFNIGSGEIALIAVVALLILGPSRLPELARGIGKFMREFRRQTDEVRGVVEREFYKMDSELQKDMPPLEIHAADDAVPNNPHSTPAEIDALPSPGDQVSSQLTGGTPESTPVEPAPKAEQTDALPPTEAPKS